MLSISLSSAPQNLKSFNSIFLSKTSHSPRSPMKSLDSSKDENHEINFVLNCSKRVLSIFQNFKFHNDLCEKCNRFVDQAINILEEMKNLSDNNKKGKLIESNEYNHFNNLIFDIEFYLRKYDQRTAVQSEVKESIQEFALNLESCINSFRQVFEAEKSKKTGGWSPSVISKVKTIGRLIAMSKHPESIKEEDTHDDENNNDDDDDDDFACEEENPNRLIIQQELIISTGIHRGANNIRKGIFINEEIAEKYIGNISKKSHKFSKFQKEISYVKNLSRDCNNILSVNGYFERNGCLWVVEEWAEYNLLNYLRENLNLDWKIKLTIACGIANALNYIHNLNLLHYNVKIDNILLNQNLEPKLHNFGKYKDNGCIYLKPFQPSNWTAPEIKRKEDYNSASEVYSFGVILWEIATQDCQSEDEFIERRYVDDAPVNYLTLMGRALNKEPHNRPTMQEMFESLHQLKSSYNVRYQKIPLERNMSNTNSIASTSSEDSPILNDESCITSRANSIPTSPTLSSDDGCNSTFTNEVIDVPTSPTLSDDDCSTIKIIDIEKDLEQAIKFHENRHYSKAFKLFNECNRKNPTSSVAKYWIGLYYYKGYYKVTKSSQQSIKLSLKYFGEAAKLNHPDAQYYYSRILLNNPSTDSEENRFQIALDYLKKASDQNHPASMRWLGKIMSKGEFGCKKDIETSKKLTDRSRRLSKGSADSRHVNISNSSTTTLKSNVNVKQKKSRALSNPTATSRSIITSNQASKRNSTLFGNTTLTVNTNKTRNRHSTLF
ncbi:kinase-like domain-containing protein [Rhizophagus diaphanus]|nr:kinase-like domain-containing protein [Rhizophagus diaphanus] [Rhizophagus sp. MUCL 43196]